MKIAVSVGCDKTYIRQIVNTPRWVHPLACKIMQELCGERELCAWLVARSNASKMPSLVVDSGRLHWRIGRAGEDSPDAGVPSMQTVYDASVFLQPGDQQAWRERWEANWALFEAYERTLSIGDDDTGDEDASYDGIAVFTASVFDGPDTGHIHDIANRVFAPGSKLRITHIHFVLQELCILYSNGRTTGLVINLGHELTILGVYEGNMLGETARRSVMTHEDVYLHDDFQWEDSVQLAELVMSAIMSAPIDTRRDLLGNIVIGGGRWGGWPQLASHLTSWLEPLVASRLPALPPLSLKVIKSMFFLFHISKPNLIYNQ